MVTGARDGAVGSPWVLLFCAALGCEPIVEPVVVQEAARCQVACPAACPGDCLPSGYCRAYTRTAGELGFGPLPSEGTWTASFKGFPSAAMVLIQVHAGFDITSRQGQVPYGFTVNLMSNEYWVVGIKGAQSSFPVWSDWETPVRTGSDGAAALVLTLGSCVDRGLETCTIAPDSTLHVTLLNAGPYQEAPLCE